MPRKKGSLSRSWARGTRVRRAQQVGGRMAVGIAPELAVRAVSWSFVSHRGGSLAAPDRACGREQTASAVASIVLAVLGSVMKMIGTPTIDPAVVGKRGNHCLGSFNASLRPRHGWICRGVAGVM